MNTVGLYTLGCKVSQYETEAIAEGFEARGFRVVPFSERADVYVVNTCTVTAESDRKSRQVIRRAVKKNPDAAVLVTGCYSQRSPEELLRLGGVLYVGGTARKMKLVDAAERLLAAKRAGERPAPVCDVAPLDGERFEPMTVRHAPRTRAYVKIEDGCEGCCAYCAIPSARGGVRSKAPLDVLAEVNALAEGGTVEVVLTGIEIASYGRDLEGVSLIDLLELLEKESTVTRIRLGSMTPEAVTEDFAKRIARVTKMVPHFHLSMQSGSDAVLRGMKRRYNTEMALAALDRLRRVMPHVCFTTDMMVGFPGEGEKEFSETLDFTRKAGFLDMHVFAYSKRKNTPAATYEGQVEEERKRQRSARLIALAEELRDAKMDEVVRDGRPLSVLFETRDGAYMTGHSAEFIPVRVETKDALSGVLRTVLPTSFKAGVLYGILVD